jgi:hypothetical protein
MLTRSFNNWERTYRSIFYWTSPHFFFFFFLLWRCDPTWVMVSSFLMFLDHTQRRTTFGRIRLDEWSARRRNLFLKTHNTHNRQTSMPPLGFEPTISAGDRPQTYALDRAVTGTSPYSMILPAKKSHNRVIQLSSQYIRIILPVGIMNPMELKVHLLENNKKRIHRQPIPTLRFRTDKNLLPKTK